MGLLGYFRALYRSELCENNAEVGEIFAAIFFENLINLLFSHTATLQIIYSSNA